MFEKFFLKKIELWVVFLLLILFIVFVPLFGWVVQYKAHGGYRGGVIGDIILDIAEAPNSLVLLVDKGFQAAREPQRIEFSEFSNLQILDKNFSDQGTLLISGYNLEHKISTVYLYDIQNAKKIYEWVPPFDEIASKTSYHLSLNSRARYQTQHPVFLPDGSLIFSSGQGPLVKIDRCGKLEWVIDRHFHHTIEMGPDDTLYIPHVMAKPSDPFSVTWEGHKVSPIRDDGFATVSLDGKILEEWSIKDILERHGYIGLLYGVGGYEGDRIHLNDVEPIMETDEFVRKGDVVLSVRHLSTVFLYRPSTDEIIWLETGPWLNQHDVDYHGNGLFTIFGNDMIRGEAENPAYNEYNTIYYYDQKTGKTGVYRSLEKEEIYTASEGLHTVLSNGDMLIEESNKQILHRVGKDKTRWKYVNTLNKEEVGAIHWCRYLEKKPSEFQFLTKDECK